MCWTRPDLLSKYVCFIQFNKTGTNCLRDVGRRSEGKTEWKGGHILFVHLHQSSFSQFNICKLYPICVQRIEMIGFSLIQDHFSELNLIELRKGHHERHLYSFVMAISEAGTLKSWLHCQIGNFCRIPRKSWLVVVAGTSLPSVFTFPTKVQLHLCAMQDLRLSPYKHEINFQFSAVNLILSSTQLQLFGFACTQLY